MTQSGNFWIHPRTSCWWPKFPWQKMKIVDEGEKTPDNLNSLYAAVSKPTENSSFKRDRWYSDIWPEGAQDVWHKILFGTYLGKKHLDIGTIADVVPVLLLFLTNWEFGHKLYMDRYFSGTTPAVCRGTSRHNRKVVLQKPSEWIRDVLWVEIWQPRSWGTGRQWDGVCIMQHTQTWSWRKFLRRMGECPKAPSSQSNVTIHTWAV